MLFKKMLRDMKEHKGQFISIFLMAFIGVYVFAGIGGEWKGLEEVSSNFYKDTNIADVWLVGNSFSDEDVKDLKNIENTTGVERQLVLSMNGKLKGDPEITTHFIEKDTISKPYLFEGQNFDIDDEDGIWLDKRFAESRNLVIGDNISIKTNGIEINKQIKGLIYSPEYVYDSSDDGLIPDFHEKGFAYLSYKAFPTDDISYNTLLLTTSSKNFDDYEYIVNKSLNNSYSIFLSKEDHVSVNQFNEEITQHKMMGDIFPVIFLLIAFLTLMTTMTRIVNNQRTQIGILKANGFNNKSILVHYIYYGFWLTLFGSILGLILGPLTLPYLFYPSMSSFFTLPFWKPAFDLNFIVLAGFVIISSTLITYLSVKNIIKEKPASAIKPKAPKQIKKGFFEKTKFWKKASFNFRWNMRDVKRNKIRSIMTIVGVIGCSALLICAFTMNNSMNDLKEWKYGDITQYKSTLSIDDNTTNE